MGGGKVEDREIEEGNKGGVVTAKETWSTRMTSGQVGDFQMAGDYYFA